MDRDLKYNGEGYYDPTAYKALKNAKKSERMDDMNKLLHVIFDICKLSGFHVEGRIVLKDMETGEIYK